MKITDIEINKISASILLAGLIIIIISNIADVIYGEVIQDNDTEYNYMVPENVSENYTNTSGKETVDNAVDIYQLLKNANIDNGKAVAKKCMACHSFSKDGGHKVGPNLWNILLAKRARYNKFNYSNAMLAQEGEWNYKALYEFIYDPKSYIKGTRMAFVGIKKPQQVADLIMYIREMSDNKAALPNIE